MERRYIEFILTRFDEENNARELSDKCTEGLTNIMKTNPNPNVVILRAFAIFLIVFGHSIILYSSWNIMHTTIDSPVLCFIKERIINPFQLNIFFAISGYLFYITLQNGQSNWYICRKKLKRLMLPYFFIAFLWMNPIKILLGIPGYSSYDEIRMTIIEQFLMKGNGHLWYLPTLMIIFIFCLFVYKHVHNSFHALLVFIGSLILQKYHSLLFTDGPFNNFGYFLFPFTIGFIVHYINWTLPRKVSILSLCITFLGEVILPKYHMLFITSFIILALKSPVLDNGKVNKIIGGISKNSYGIYLLHSPLIYITYKYIGNSSPLYVVTLNLIFGVVAYVITDLIRRTKLKFVIGE